MSLKKLLNQDQAAEVLGVSPRTLESWRYNGGGPRFYKLGQAVRYRAEDLDAWIEAGARHSTSDPGPEPVAAGA